MNFDFGAPGQSTLNTGLAMSVTFRLYFFSRRNASAISVASSLVLFLFQSSRISTHPIPNCCEATSQAWPKSCEISSVMTEILNGDFARRAESDCDGPGKGAAETEALAAS